MWEGLHDIAQHHKITINDLVTQINERRDPSGSLTSAIRVRVVEFYRDRDK
jgi:predicted DNA-binding ribbon-helix-helix protein